MAGDEVRDELLSQVFLGVDAVEYLFKLSELAERGLAHNIENAVAGMFRCNFQSSANMLLDQFAGTL